MSKTPRSGLKISPIYLLLGLYAGIGLLLLPQYGDSWDEFKFYKYANLTLRSAEWFTRGEMPTFGNTYDNYGPVFAAGVTLVTRILGEAAPARLVSQVRHGMVFFTYLAGVYAFYQLSRRWLSAWAAFGAALLFSSQPLLWGHAFISPKDIPVMAFFLLSLHLGLKMTDQVWDSGQWAAIQARWAQLPNRQKRRFGLVAGGTVFGAALLVLGSQPGYALIEATLREMYTAPTPTLLGRVFTAVAEDAFSAEVEIYITKAILAFQQARFFLLLLSPLPIYLVGLSLLGRDWRRLLRPIIWAGLMLGLATSIRILAPLAAVLVGLQALRRAGRKSI